MSDKPEKSSSEVLDEIVELGGEAEFTDEESREELRDAGVDPDQLVRRVVADVEQLFKNHPPERYSPTDPAAEPRPLLGVLRDRTKLMPTVIADRLGVTVAFLSDVNRHAKSLPGRWLDALAERAEGALEVPREVVLGALASPFQYARAANRDASYEEECPTCEEILSRSGMNEEAKEFWRGLAEEK